MERSMRPLSADPQTDPEAVLSTSTELKRVNES
jgi:hypothetical protein